MGATLKVAVPYYSSTLPTQTQEGAMNKGKKIEEAKSIFDILKEGLGMAGCCQERFVNFWLSRGMSINLSQGFTFYKGNGLCVDRAARYENPDNKTLAEELNRAMREICPSLSPSIVGADEEVETPVTVR